MKIVTACSLFVPGHWRKKPSIIPWQTKALKMSDLASIKLIGLSKQYPITRAVEVYFGKKKYLMDFTILFFLIQILEVCINFGL